MRTIILTVLLGLLALAPMAQLPSSNLVIFTELGQDFTVKLNGVPQANTAAQHVRVSDLPPGRYRLEVLLVNGAAGPLTTDVEVRQGREISYAVMQSGAKGKLGLEFLSEFSLGYFPVAPQNVLTVGFSALSTTSVPSTLTQPTQVVVTAPSGILGTPPVDTRPDPLPGYTGRRVCDYPMDAATFEQAKTAIASKSFSDTKMQVAMQATRGNCLLTSQVRQLMDLFSFESQKLEYAKFAFDFTYDVGNYYRINDGFGFESSIRELEAYLNGK